MNKMSAASPSERGRPSLEAPGIDGSRVRVRLPVDTEWRTLALGSSRPKTSGQNTIAVALSKSPDGRVTSDEWDE